MNRQKVKKLFGKNKEITCPAFPKEKIYLNSKGISHLFYKGSEKKYSRNNKEIRTRVSLLPRAIKVLKKSTFYQEERSYRIDNKMAKYWAFEAVVDKRRIKVIVRQVGRGQKHFWSIIPAWRRIGKKVINAKGSLINQ